MAVKVGELYQELSLKDNKFTSGMTQAQNKMQGFSSRLSSAGGTLTKFVTGPMALLGGALLENARRTGNYADSILDLESATGHTTDTIQRYQAVAERAGVKTTAFTDASQRLLQQMSRSEGGSASLNEGLQKLGLTFEDISEATPDERMNTLITRLRGVEDANKRAQIGTQLLRGGYEDLAPILDLSEEKFNQVAKQAKESGKIMDTDALNSANNFRMSLDELKQEFTGLMRSIAKDFMPVLTDSLMPFLKNSLIPLMRNLSGMVANLFDWFNNLSSGMKTVFTVGVGLLGMLGPLLTALSGIVSASVTLAPLLSTIAGGFAAISAPVVGVVAGVTAFAGAATLVYRSWKEVSTMLADLWTAMRVNVSNFAIKSQIAFEKMKIAIFRIVNSIIQKMSALENLPFGVGEKFAGMGDSITDSVDGAKQSISELVYQMYENEQDLANANSNFSESFGNAKDAIVSDITGILDKLNIFSNEYEGKVEEVSELVSEKYKFQTDEIEANINEQNEIVNDGLQERKNIEKRYADMWFEMSHNKIEILEKEKKEAIKNAQEKGADITNIEKVYDEKILQAKIEKRRKEAELERQRWEAMNERGRKAQEEAEAEKQAEIEKEQTIREQVRKTNEAKMSAAQRYMSRLIEQNASEKEMLILKMNRELEANKGNEAAIFAIKQYYQNEIDKLEEENHQKSMERTEKELSFLQTGFAYAFSSILQGTKSVTEAFHDMWINVLNKVMDKLAEMAASKVFGFITGGGGGGLLGGVGDFFGGIFHNGGTVPGPIGQERLILAQAGETVSPIGSNTGSSGGGYSTANISVNLDGRTIAQAVKQPLVDDIRIKGGARF
jgi:hypothetical protein